MKLVKPQFPILILIILVLFYFFKLFYPEPSLFITPDFGRSDIWHFNYPLKEFLSQSLKSGHLPLWNKDIGTGFPLLAEGQIGTFNLYNLLAFWLLPTWLAFNFGFVVIFLATAVGTYLYCRTIKLSPIASLIAATVFTFSGPLTMHISHFNLIQTASFLPWEFYLLEKWLAKKQKRWAFALSFVISQQIFSGFPQLTMISLIGLTIYFIQKVRPFASKRSDLSASAKILFAYLLICLFAIFITLPQLLSTYKFVQQSFRSNSIPLAEMTRFPYHPKNLLTFIKPFYFGNPKTGTYPLFSKDWGIFWESTGYIGILPLIFAFIVFILWLKSQFYPSKNRFHSLCSCYLLIVVLSLILMLGKYTPFFFVFQIPPLSFFRVPARFIFLFVWSLSIISGIGFESLIKKLQKSRKNQFEICHLSASWRIEIHLFICLFVYLFIILDLFHFSYHYHPTAKVGEWLKPPETAQFLSQDKSDFRIFSIGNWQFWNETFLKDGWQDTKPYYFFRNGLDPNLNLVFNTKNIHAYAAFATRRQDLIETLLLSNISFPDEKTASISATTIKLLSLQSTKYIITPYAIQDAEKINLELVFETREKLNNITYKVYENKKVLPQSYYVEKYLAATTIEDLKRKMLDTHINPLETVILEEPNMPQKIPEGYRFYVVSESYYPGWKAFVNGKESKIYPVNLNQRAILVPPGSHQISFSYSLL